MTRCKACGSGFPTALLLAASGWSWESHQRACSGRSLDVALGNVKRWSGNPPAEYIVDHELVHIKRCLLTSHETEHETADAAA